MTPPQNPPHRRRRREHPPDPPRDEERRYGMLRRLIQVEDAIPDIKRNVEHLETKVDGLSKKVEGMSQAAATGVIGLTGRLDELQIAMTAKVLPGLETLLAERTTELTRRDWWVAKGRTMFWWSVRAVAQGLVVGITLGIIHLFPGLEKAAWQVALWFLGKF